MAALMKVNYRKKRRKRKLTRTERNLRIAEFSLTVLNAPTTRGKKGYLDSLSSTVTEAEWRATNYSINLLTVLQVRINHFINS